MNDVTFSSLTFCDSSVTQSHFLLLDAKQPKNMILTLFSVMATKTTTVAERLTVDVDHLRKVTHQVKHDYF